VFYVAMMFDGYHSAVQSPDAIQFSRPGQKDILGVSATNDERWQEVVGADSTIESSKAERGSIPHATSPVASVDGRWIAYLREDQGRARAWGKDMMRPADRERAITPDDQNVMEMSFTPSGALIYSATSGGRPHLLMMDETGKAGSLSEEDARYPAVSPNGHWLAYSHLEGGNWRLWLRNLEDGHAYRLSEATCNNISATWTANSKELIYGSDCGRALWFTALCKRRVLP
jgi:Tol biopolymer transport system component